MNINKDLNKICGILLAKAISDMYPTIILGNIQVGDEINNEYGFTYSFDLEERLNHQSFGKIQKQMQKNIDRNYKIEYLSISKSQALKIFKNNKYKIELINDFSTDKVDIVKFGDDYTDICEQLSIMKLSAIKEIKLNNIGGVYWKHSSKNKQLQAISGVAFESKEQVKDYEDEIKDRQERDHRYINKNMELFFINDTMAGPGLPFWLPNGAATKYVIDEYVHRLLVRNGYQYVQTPVLGKKELYETSGHWFHYRENMFAPCQVDNDVEVLRPMTCPHHLLVYQFKPRSYRELPFRVFEDAILHRYESSGSLIGLERVRQLRLIDTHVVCALDQIKDAVGTAYKVIEEASKKFNLEPQWIDLSLHDPKNKEKFFDGEETWQKAENLLRNLLDEMKIKYKEEVGEAAFYGPKIDMQLKTPLGHVITAYTIQLDFLLPERFQLEYIDDNGKKQRPVLVHASVIGTLERFMATLLEKNKGIFPLWLAPIQVEIIPIDNEKHNKKCLEIKQALLNNDIRVHFDIRIERLSKKIRDAQIAKIPYQIIIGDDEINSATISYREYGKEESHKSTVNDFVKLVKTIVNNN
ncbi:MAG: threonine--tRNA ligase [Mycoplasmataceae bacterium]|nr:threonine--tRNA ligase [Mycoplasmataceae bacterium]